MGQLVLPEAARGIPMKKGTFFSGRVDEPSFRIDFKVPDNNYHMDFDVWEVIGKEDNGEHMYRDCNGNPSYTLVPEAVWLTGHIKWDGCSNMSWLGAGAMIHICGRRHLELVKNLLNDLYNRARIELKDHWYDD